ncbi:MAG TPA: T9SS type A sorting domain-containing protein [Bacteroidia bacterium]
MKKSLFVVLLTLVTSVFFGQSTPASLQWERSQNGVAGRTNYFVKAKNDISGNVYALSYSDGDMLVVKFNTSAQIAQTFIYNNQENSEDYPLDFEIDANGYVYMTGYSYMNSGYYMTMVKFDPNGNLVWEQNYRQGYWVYPTEISSNAMCIDNSGNTYMTGAINDSLIAVKLNPSGGISWITKVNIGSQYLGSGKDIAVDAFGSVYVCGKYENAGGNFDVVTFKLNSSGVVQWTKQLAGLAGADDEGVNIGVDNSSNVFVSSIVADSSATNYTTYLTKYNASGAQQWQKKIHQSTQVNSAPVELFVDNVGNNYIGLHVNETSALGYAKIYKYNSSGSQLYTYVIDTPTEDDNILSDIYVDGNANLYAAGYFEAFSGKAFYEKINSTGNYLLGTTYDHGGMNNISSKVGIVAEQSGFFNLVTCTGKMFNMRFNNSGTFLFEGIYSGNANTNDKAVKVIAQGNNSVYALGSVTNDITQMDVVLSKYDSEGNILWQNIIDNNLEYEDPSDMAKDSIYNIYLLKGTSVTSDLVKYDSIGSPIWDYTSNIQYKKVIVANGAYSYLAGDYNGFQNTYTGFHVAKVSPAGTQVYANSLTAAAGYSIYVNSMNVDGNGRIVVAGTRRYNVSLPDQKVALVLERFSPSGNLSWHRELTLPDSTTNTAVNNCYVSKVLVDVSNDIYVLGTATTEANFGHSMSVLAKYNSNGTLIWDTIYDGNGAWHENTGDMKFLSNGQIIIYSVSPGEHIIRKINPNNGNIVWETRQGLGYSNDAASINIDQNDDIYFAGAAIHGNSVRDIVIGKVTSTGTFKWAQYKAGSQVGNDFATHIDVTTTGRIYVSALMNNTSGTSYDFSVLKFCDIAQPTLTTADQTQNICPGSTVTMVAPASSTYLWSDGTTTNDSLIVSANGNYFCTAYKSDGCYKNSDTVNVHIKDVPSTPQICAVTVDSLSTHNIIFWDKSNVTGATAFNIYREDQTSVYSYIGTVLYDSLSEFHDYGANPNVTTKRYKITAIDTCGQESPMSNYHNTIYIVSNGSGQFSWNPIYTIENNPNPVDNYLLMRDDNSTGNWQQIASTAGTQFIINDANYGLYPNGRWRVETAWNIGCLATRGAINTSRSNIRNPTSTIGLNDVTNAFDFGFMPNPATGEITIRTGTRTNVVIEIYNTLGQKVLETKTVDQETIVSISSLQAGTYFIKVKNEKGSSTKKLIVN